MSPGQQQSMREVLKKNYVDLALKHRDFTYGVGAGNVHRAWDTLRGKQVKLG